jgi:hypothetical protein
MTVSKADQFARDLVKADQCGRRLAAELNRSPDPAERIKARDLAIVELIRALFSRQGSLAFDDHYVRGKAYPVDVCVIHAGALWRSLRATTGEPGRGDSWEKI